jgi:prevent-host-death family protein
MKSISAGEAQSNLESVLTSAQKERIVLTRNGKPSVVLIGVENYDGEDLRLASSPEFWQMIEERRRGPSIPLSELKARLRAREKSARRNKPSGGRRQKRTT